VALSDLSGTILYCFSYRATAIKDNRVNIRLSSGDLKYIQVKALEEGIPYQTSIKRVA
jgi:predicted DNA binding CopG/RHH family protein